LWALPATMTSSSVPPTEPAVPPTESPKASMPAEALVPGKPAKVVIIGHAKAAAVKMGGIAGPVMMPSAGPVIVIGDSGGRISVTLNGKIRAPH
jgi:hypothetical protein